MSDENLIKLTADQYELRIQALTDHIKMMINTGAYGDRSAVEVASDIRTRLKTMMRDSHVACATLSACAHASAIRDKRDKRQQVANHLAVAHAKLAEAIEHNEDEWTSSTDRCIVAAQREILAAASNLP